MSLWARLLVSLGYAGLAAILLLTAGCPGQNQPERTTGGGGIKANGEAYGIAYHLEPDYSCVRDSGERVPSYKNALRTEADGSVYLLGDLCSMQSPELVPTQSVEVSSYYPELSGYGPDIYEKKAAAPSPLEKELYFVEAWCRVDGATALDGFDVSVHYSLYDRIPRVRFRKSQSSVPDIPANAFLFERGANRTETEERALYEMDVAGTPVALSVEWNRSIEQGNKFEGSLKNVTTGTTYAMRCRAVSTVKTFVQRMARISVLKGTPPVPESGGKFYEYNESRTCKKFGGQKARGYSSALVRDEVGPKEIQPSFCRPADPVTPVDLARIETSTYNPRYIGYGPAIYEYRPNSTDADLGYGAVPLIWCRTKDATASRGMDLVLLFKLDSDERGFRFSSDGMTKAELSDQWYVGHLLAVAPLTASEGLITVRNLLPWRDIKLDISTTPLSPTDTRYPAFLEAMTQDKRSRQEMTCRVSADIIPR